MIITLTLFLNSVLGVDWAAEEQCRRRTTLPRGRSNTNSISKVLSSSISSQLNLTFQYSCSDFRVCGDFLSGEKQEKLKKEQKLQAKKNKMKVSVCFSISHFFFRSEFYLFSVKKIWGFVVLGFLSFVWILILLCKKVLAFLCNKIGRWMLR